MTAVSWRGAVAGTSGRGIKLQDVRRSPRRRLPGEVRQLRLLTGVGAGAPLVRAPAAGGIRASTASASLGPPALQLQHRHAAGVVWLRRSAGPSSTARRCIIGAQWPRHHARRACHSDWGLAVGEDHRHADRRAARGAHRQEQRQRGSSSRAIAWHGSEVLAGEQGCRAPPTHEAAPVVGPAARLRPRDSHSTSAL